MAGGGELTVVVKLDGFHTTTLVLLNLSDSRTRLGWNYLWIHQKVELARWLRKRREQVTLWCYYCNKILTVSVLEYRAIYPYIAQRDDEVSLNEGEVVLVFETADSGWWRGSVGHSDGWFPGNYVEVMSILTFG